MRQKLLGVDLIAWFYIVLTIPAFGSICFVLILLATGIIKFGDPGGGGLLSVSLIVVLMVLSSFSSVLLLTAGWGLLKVKHWARILAMIVAALMLLAFPIGTVFGGLILWYLGFNEEVKRSFAPA
jgi:hypothetical protein